MVASRASNSIQLCQKADSFGCQLWHTLVFASPACVTPFPPKDDKALFLPFATPCCSTLAYTWAQGCLGDRLEPDQRLLHHLSLLPSFLTCCLYLLFLCGACIRLVRMPTSPYTHAVTHVMSPNSTFSPRSLSIYWRHHPPHVSQEGNTDVRTGAMCSRRRLGKRLEALGEWRCEHHRAR
jgi:hypothetical protein